MMLACLLAIGLTLVQGDMLWGYPYDGYALTGIRRLERLRLILAGVLQGPHLLPGQQRSLKDIKLHLTGARGDSLAALLEVDPGLRKRLDALFSKRDKSYAFAVLDITPGRPVRYAERHADQSYAPGSVGKLAIAAGLFTELRRLYPNDPERAAAPRRRED